MSLRLRVSLLPFLLLYSLASHAHAAPPHASSALKKDGRFTFQLERRGVGLEFARETGGLMKHFSLHIQWWTLLGEPVEYYDFRWESTGAYRIGGRTIQRSQLKPYPDLLRRFDALRPTTIELAIHGRADGGRGESRRGVPPSFNGYKGNHAGYRKRQGQAYDLYHLYADFEYRIPDRKLLYTRAGVTGKGIIPGSPHWNRFLDWSGEKGYQTGDPKDAVLTERNKDFFRRAQEISLDAELVILEWPVREFQSIAEKFDRYESGEESPPPMDQVAAARESVEKLEPYERDDYWSVIPEPHQRELEPFEAPGVYGAVREGLRDKRTGEIVVEATFNMIRQLPFADGSYIWRLHDGRINARKIEEGNRYNAYSLVDASGTPLFEHPFHRVEVKEGQLVLKRVVREGEVYTTSSSSSSGPARKGELRLISSEVHRYRKCEVEVTVYDARLKLISRAHETLSLPALD